MKSNVTEGVLLASIVGDPEFGKVVIWDGVNKLIAKDVLHSDPSAICLFGIFLLGFTFRSMAGTGSIGDCRMQSGIDWEKK